MGQHKLNLSAEKRTDARNRFNAIKKIKPPKPSEYPIYLPIGNSNIGRNKAKRVKRMKEVK